MAVKFNLTIPDDLKISMDKHDSVNWSQVAREAFTNKINDLESKKKVDSMVQAISRLKASREKFSKAAEKKGFEDGHTWAMQFAEYDHLKRLDNYNNLLESTSLSINRFDFMKAVTNNDNESVEVFDEYDEDAQIDDEDYLSGFLEGALTVFNEVEED